MNEDFHRASEDDVKEFVLRTGFLHELKSAEVLRTHGYNVHTGEHYFDLDDRKYREYDIWARKEISGIEVNLIMECKRSAKDVWVFVSHQKRHLPGYLVKHVPAMEIGAFDVFKSCHYFSDSPQASNYTAFDKFSKKKSNSLQIMESLSKLPKAVVDIVSHLPSSSGKKRLYFPVTLFDGQVFSLKYDNGIRVKDEYHIKYLATLLSPMYLLEPNSYLDEVFGTDVNNARAILRTVKTMSENFIVDVVTAEGLGNFIGSLEEGVRNTELSRW
jgi:hypothetical protein